jgi:hypothetical protein
MGESIGDMPEMEEVLGAVNPSPIAHDMMKYDHQKSVSIIQATRYVEINPSHGGNYRERDMAEFALPTTDFLKPDDFAIAMDVRIFSGIGSSQLGTKTGVPARWRYLDNTSPRTNNNLGFKNISYYFADTETVSDPKFTGPAVAATANPFPPILDDQGPSIAENVTTANSLATLEAEQRVLSINRHLYNPIGAGTFVTTCNGIQKIFNRVVLLQGTVVIHDIQRYNYLFPTLVKAMASKGYRQTSGFLNEGIREDGNQDQFLTSCVWSSYERGKRYMVKPLLGLFNAGKLLPTLLMGQLTIRIYFENNTNCLISSTFQAQDTAITSVNSIKNEYKPLTNANIGIVSCPNAYYQVDNMRAMCTYVVPEDDYTDALMKRVQDGGLEIHTDGYVTMERQIAAFSGTFQMNLQDRAVSLKGVMGVIVKNTDIDDIRTEMALFDSAGIEYYQWKIGSEYIPAQHVRCEVPGYGSGYAEAYTQLEFYFDRFGEITAHGEIDHWNFSRRPINFIADTPSTIYKKRKAQGATHFILPLQLEKVPGMISGWNPLAANVDIELMLKMGDSETATSNRSYVYLLPHSVGKRNPSDYNSGFTEDDYTVAQWHQKVYGDPDGINGMLAPKADPTRFNFFFFSHRDVLFILKGIGASEIRA